jgi:hypothetical protein
VGLHLFAHAALPIPTDFPEVNPDALGSRVEKLEIARRDSVFVPIDRAHLDSLSAQVGPDNHAKRRGLPTYLHIRSARVRENVRVLTTMVFVGRCRSTPR